MPKDMTCIHPRAEYDECTRSHSHWDPFSIVLPDDVTIVYLFCDPINAFLSLARRHASSILFGLDEDNPKGRFVEAHCANLRCSPHNLAHWRSLETNAVQEATRRYQIEKKVEFHLALLLPCLHITKIVMTCVTAQTLHIYDGLLARSRMLPFCHASIARSSMARRSAKASHHCPLIHFADPRTRVLLAIRRCNAGQHDYGSFPIPRAHAGLARGVARRHPQPEACHLCRRNEPLRPTSQVLSLPHFPLLSSLPLSFAPFSTTPLPFFLPSSLVIATFSSSLLISANLCFPEIACQLWPSAPPYRPFSSGSGSQTIAVLEPFPGSEWRGSTEKHPY